MSDVPVCFAQFAQYAAKFFPTKFNPLFLIITDGSERKRFAASYYCDNLCSWPHSDTNCTIHYKQTNSQDGQPV